MSRRFASLAVVEKTDEPLRVAPGIRRGMRASGRADGRLGHDPTVAEKRWIITLIHQRAGFRAQTASVPTTGRDLFALGDTDLEPQPLELRTTSQWAEMTARIGGLADARTGSALGLGNAAGCDVALPG